MVMIRSLPLDSARPPARRVRLLGSSLAFAVLIGVTGCTATLDANGGDEPVSAGSDPQPAAGSPAAGSSTGRSAIGENPTGSALAALDKIRVKGRAPSTGYARDQFGPAWTDTDNNGCDQRNDVLRRDLTGETLRAGTRGCVVLTGTLADPYTGARIAFTKAAAGKVQIDHVVALQNAWVSGAFGWSEKKRTALATDPLNLLAVDGPTNSAKGAGDAATWLPPRTSYRCSYVARQVAVKVKYGAWTTAAEHAAMTKILTGCPDQKLPQVTRIPLGGSGTRGSGSGSTAVEVVAPGAYCGDEGAEGVTDAGTEMVCSVKDGQRPRWRSAKD